MTYYEKRLALVKRMDLIITTLNDEELIERWLIDGCPDESSDEDYEYFAENADAFLDLVSLFTKIVDEALEECREELYKTYGIEQMQEL